MIYLELFLTFLQIGAVSFGGGYAMISLIREQVLSHNWLSESDFLNMVAVSESTPGPIAVNMATFIGASQGGLLRQCFLCQSFIFSAFPDSLSYCHFHSFLHFRSPKQKYA